jgi:hypothetical protein
MRVGFLEYLNSKHKTGNLVPLEDFLTYMKTFRHGFSQEAIEIIIE